MASTARKPPGVVRCAGERGEQSGSAGWAAIPSSCIVRMVHGGEHVIGNVAVYLVRGSLLITSNSRDINGVYVINGWLEILSADASDEALGRSIRTGLSRTEDGVAAPPHDDPDRSRALAALVRAAGARTYTAFVRASTLALDVWTAGDDRGIRITPMHNGGTRGPQKGFAFLPERERTLPVDAPAADVGRAAREALHHAS
jgi:hypothetical protein